MADSNVVYQFKITLNDISPAIWRRIQVPRTYSFWDLHVAIQDAMGWLDSHLHAFSFRKQHPKAGVQIGIPDGDLDDDVLPGWETPIDEYFTEPGDAAQYQYDFGDNWEHTVLLEGIFLKEKRVKYPRCIAGERACPPEDCGSVPGYFNILEILADPQDEEYEDTVDWLKGYGKKYHPYNPDAFDPKKVRFDDPIKRRKQSFTF